MNRFHPSPHLYVATTLLTTLISFFLFQDLGFHDVYYFVPIFALSLLWAVANYRRQLHESSHYYIDSKSTLLQVAKRSFVRYVIWLIIFYFGITFYETHGFYQNYVKSIEFLNTWLDLYIKFGFIYFFLTLKFKASRTEDFYDPAVRILHIAKEIIRGTIFNNPKRPPFAVLRRKYNRKVLLNIVMRGYFIPIMVAQVFAGFTNSVGIANSQFNNYDPVTLLVWLSGMLWLADALSASTGYCIESRWVENRSRSIDLTAGGWLICLCCYAPLNQATTTLFFFGPNVATNNPEDLLFADPTFFIVFKVIEVLLLIALIYSDLSLGPSGVNITLKKLQTRGPYGLVRHPATTCKLSFWWLQSMVYVPFWSWELILGHLMWNVIYVLRALSEERHLKQFPEYRDYMEKVRYRFIPGII